MYDDLYSVSKTSLCDGPDTFFGTSVFFLSEEDLAFKIKESVFRIKVALFHYDFRELTVYLLRDKKKRKTNETEKETLKENNTFLL